jgi:transposase
VSSKTVKALGDRNDITELIPLVDRVPPIGRDGKFRPKVLLADRAYDSRKHREQLRERGITPRIAKRNTTNGSGLGKERRVVERTISRLHQHRRLERRHDRRDDIHEAFLAIGCALICHQQLQRSFC